MCLFLIFDFLIIFTRIINKKHCVFFIHSNVFLFVNRDGIYAPHSLELTSHYLNIYFACYDLKEFVFSHDKAASSLKEYFHALEMENAYICGIYI